MPERESTEILDALARLGGYGTVKEIAKELGLSESWTKTLIYRHIDTRTLQASNLNPKVYSSTKLPKVPLQTFDLANNGIYKLIKQTQHILGRNTNKDLDRLAESNRSSATLSSKNLKELCRLAGYKILLVPIDGDKK